MKALFFLLLIIFNISSFAMTTSHLRPIPRTVDKATGESCSKIFQDAKFIKQRFYGETPYRLIEKSESWMPQDLYKDYSPTDIFIGFTFIGHTYFMIDGHRYDGGFGLLFGAGKIRKRDNLSPGVIFRIKQVSDHLTEKLIISLESKEKPISITCSSGVCSYLDNNGLKTTYLSRFIPSMLFAHIIKNGIKTKDGEQLDVDLTVLGVRSIERSINYIKWGEVLTTLIPISPILGLTTWSAFHNLFN